MSTLVERTLEKSRTVYRLEWLEDARREARALHHIVMDPREKPSTRIAAARAAVSVRAQLVDMAGLPSRPKAEPERKERGEVPGLTLTLENPLAEAPLAGSVQVETFPELDSGR